jgi:hypothetical protein
MHVLTKSNGFVDGLSKKGLLVDPRIWHRWETQGDFVKGIGVLYRRT